MRLRVSSLPAWFEVRTVQETRTSTFPVTLHRGDREAILLTEALRARAFNSAGKSRVPLGAVVEFPRSLRPIFT